MECTTYAPGYATTSSVAKVFKFWFKTWSYDGRVPLSTLPCKDFALKQKPAVKPSDTIFFITRDTRLIQLSMDSVIVNGHFKCLKKPNNWYAVHGIEHLRLHLDLMLRCPFGYVLWHLLVKMGWPVGLALTMELHGYFETIISQPRYFNLVFYMTAPLFRLVGCACPCLTWVLLEPHRLFRCFLCFFHFVATLATFGGEYVRSCDDILLLPLSHISGLLPAYDLDHWMMTALLI